MNPWLLPLLPCAGAVAVPLLRLRGRRGLGLVACASLLATLLLAIAAAAAPVALSARLVWSELLVLQLTLAPLPALMAWLVPAIALPVLAYSAAHEEERGLPRLVAGLLFFVGAMELLVGADDFLSLLVGWELVGAASWALIAHHWREPEAVPSATFAFVATRLGDLGLFAAAFVLFGSTGSFAFAGLAQLSPTSLALVAAGVLLAATSKSGQLPFSPWLFRAMAGPAPVSALLHAATMVAAGAWLLVRMQPALAAVTWFGPVTMTLGLATALAGGVVALLQDHVKKLLAASTSAHYGLMFIAVGAGRPGVALAHLVMHAAFKSLLFLGAGVAGHAAGSYSLQRMRLGRALPGAALLGAIGALALAGVPPLGAAWSKEGIFAAAASQSFAWALGTLLAGGLSAAYATRLQWSAWGPRALDDAPAAKAKDDADEDAPAALAPSVWHGVLQHKALALLALATLASCVLWLPVVQQVASRHLGLTWPEGAPWETAAAWLVLVLGVASGAAVVRRFPALGTDGPSMAVSDWLGLPTLTSRLVVRPVFALARGLARLDGLIDAVPMALVRWLARVSAAAARKDQRAIDRATVRIAAATRAVARWDARFGEWLADGLSSGGAQLIGLGAGELRRLHTGLAHHAFVWLVAGTAGLALLLYWTR